MANPPLLPCDADAVFQLLISKQVSPLKCLRERYAVQPVVTPYVLGELRNLQARMKKHKGTTRAKQFGEQIRVALANGTFLELNDQMIKDAEIPRPTNIDEIESFKLRYDVLDTGEAYTWAAGICLGSPILSNDSNAIDTGLDNNLTTPSPVLRVYDLICLCFQVGWMDSRACDGFRDALLQEDEYVPVDFAKASFERGLDKFIPRLVCGSTKQKGQPNNGKGFAALLTLTPAKVETAKET